MMRLFKKICLGVPLLWCLMSCQCEKASFVPTDSYAQVLEYARNDGRSVLLLLYDRHTSKLSQIENFVWGDELLAAEIQADFLCVSGQIHSEAWRPFCQEKGIYKGQVLLFLSPDGQIVNDLKLENEAGPDESGLSASRKRLARQCRLAQAFAEPDDSLFFSSDNWKDINASMLRIDGLLFHRIVQAKEMLKARYPETYPIVFDYAMACAAVSLVSHEEGQLPYLDPALDKAYYYVVDSMDIDFQGRYRLYGDVNKAFGLGQYEKARRVAQQAFDKGDIQENEFRQLMAKLE